MLAELQCWTVAYGVAWPEELITTQGAPLPANGTDGTNGITAQGGEI